MARLKYTVARAWEIAVSCSEHEGPPDPVLDCRNAMGSRVPTICWTWGDQSLVVSVCEHETFVFRIRGRTQVACSRVFAPERPLVWLIRSGLDWLTGRDGPGPWIKQGFTYEDLKPTEGGAEC